MLAEIDRGSIAQSSPAGMAVVCSDGEWYATKHLLHVNRKIVETLQKPRGRLLVMMPIRHGKSDLISKWLPAWYLGEHPNNSIIWASHSNGIAETYGGAARNVYEQHAPRIWGRNVASDTHAKRNWQIAGHRGGYYAGAVDGKYGSRRCNLLIIDDPYASYHEAQSAGVREMVMSAYRGTLYGRLEPRGSIIITSARWHTHDIIGQLMAASKANPNADQWEVVDLPVYAEPGDAIGRAPGELLWPQRYDEREIQGFRDEMIPRVFAAQFMNRPQEDTSAYFHRKDIREYSMQRDVFVMDDTKETFKFSECEFFETVDLAGTEKGTHAGASKTGGDWFVIGTWARHRASSMLFALNIYRDQIAGPKHLPAMIHSFKTYRPTTQYVEANGTQKFKAAEFREAGLPVVDFLPNKYGGKEERAEIAAARVVQGKFAIPGRFQRAPWRETFLQELTQYPTGTKDQVDVLAMAVILGAEKARERRLSVSSTFAE